ncbi:MAG: PLDc_N domain-containing protein [Acidobacteriota bacterium]|nr:PLDc_N domain-containing protein [Acidobacteriota bacterium]MDE3044421.1 PLDc_N domain-containing protein [Acidobacteriota bacterium]MDE3107313.1 PLDc_N domain-containing protein [Acidobacteriota bacterium]MDE3222915.1 PLDc_N domain-containing protein [Acidobacteriota bacterium]
MFATNYPMANIFVSLLSLVVMVLWVVLVVHVLADVLRSHDLSGGAKAAWVTLLIVLPFVGSLIYLVARGGSMHERHAQALQAQQRAFEDYIRKVANTKE